MDFEQLFLEQFPNLHDKYSLKIESWDSRTYAVIGTSFVLLFVGDVAGCVDVIYIIRNKEDELEGWELGWYIGMMDKEQDRSGVVERKTIVDGWRNNIILFVRALERYCPGFFAGDRRWMRDYFESGHAYGPEPIRGVDAQMANRYI